MFLSYAVGLFGLFVFFCFGFDLFVIWIGTGVNA